MPDTYTSQFSGEEIDAALRAAQMISGASTPAELREKLEIRGDTIPVSAEDSTLISEALTKIPTTSGGGINPNLLDNWYFRKPVNQRGQTSYSTEWGYTIDRWQVASNSTLTINNGSVSLTGDYVFEPLEEIADALKGKTVTVSLLFATGELEFATGVVPTTWGEWTDIVHSNHVGLQGVAKESKRLWFRIFTNAKNILAAKLELGSTQTLAHKEGDKWVLNEIPDFGEQLRRCTYYAEKVESEDTPAITNSTYVPSGATSAVFILPYARKRTVPAINFNDVSNYRIIARSISGGTTAFSATAISLLDVSRTKAAILVSFNATDQGYYCFLQRSDNAPAGYAFISADL